MSHGGKEVSFMSLPTALSVIWDALPTAGGAEPNADSPTDVCQPRRLRRSPGPGSRPSASLVTMPTLHLSPLRSPPKESRLGAR
jgi:hypothetical protein